MHSQQGFLGGPRKCGGADSDLRKCGGADSDYKIGLTSKTSDEELQILVFWVCVLKWFLLCLLRKRHFTSTNCNAIPHKRERKRRWIRTVYIPLYFSKTTNKWTIFEKFQKTGKGNDHVLKFPRRVPNQTKSLTKSRRVTSLASRPFERKRGKHKMLSCACFG